MVAWGSPRVANPQGHIGQMGISLPAENPVGLMQMQFGSRYPLGRSRQAQPGTDAYATGGGDGTTGTSAHATHPLALRLVERVTRVTIVERMVSIILASSSSSVVA